jgi:MFS family permease
MKRMAGRRALVVGALVFSAGVAGTVAALLTGWLPLLFAAAVVTGFGFGGAFLGIITLLTAGLAPGHRAGLLAAVFVVGYLAFSLPAIAAGVAVDGLGLRTTAVVYGVMVAVLALLAVAGLLLRRGTPARQPAERVEPEEVLAA